MVPCSICRRNNIRFSIMVFYEQRLSLTSARKVSAMCMAMCECAEVLFDLWTTPWHMTHWWREKTQVCVIYDCCTCSNSCQRRKLSILLRCQTVFDHDTRRLECFAEVLRCHRIDSDCSTPAAKCFVLTIAGEVVCWHERGSRI